MEEQQELIQPREAGAPQEVAPPPPVHPYDHIRIKLSTLTWVIRGLIALLAVMLVAGIYAAGR